MGIKDWPADERPREKLLDHGANTLSDAELLAIFFSGLICSPSIHSAAGCRSGKCHGPYQSGALG
jgi:DNA repair protein RadC